MITNEIRVGRSLSNQPNFKITANTVKRRETERLSQTETDRQPERRDRDRHRRMERNNQRWSIPCLGAMSST